jgi:ABC-2 type transport system permease protein
VLIVSLVQDNVMEATGEAPIRVLFVDRDDGFLGKSIEEQVRKAGGVELVRRWKGREVTEEAARKAVAEGDFQFCLVIAPGTGEALRRRMRRMADESFVPAKGEREETAPDPGIAGLTLCFDPAVQGAFRTAVAGSLQRAILGIDLSERSAALSETFTRNLKKALAERMGPLFGPGRPSSPTSPSVPPPVPPFRSPRRRPGTGGWRKDRRPRSRTSRPGRCSGCSSSSCPCPGR